MSLWRPRSVRQLVLVSFFTALAPLSIAILFTVQTITDLSENHRDMTRRVVDLTRNGDEIRWKLQEMERLVRTYRALDDPELPGEFESGKMETLFKQKREELVSTLSEMQAAIDSSSPDIAALMQSIDSLSLAAPELMDGVEAGAPDNHRIDHTFTLFYTQVNAMKKWLAAAVDQLMEENSREATKLIDSLVLLVTSLAAATLALLLLFAYWINRPVQDLTQEIHLLGTSGLSHKIEISGPEEVQVLGSKLEWLRSRLHETDQQKAQFLRHISHELKTPLASLREGADLLADQVAGRLSQQQLEIVEIVRQNGIELQRLIENLLDYNQLPNQQLSHDNIQMDRLWRELLGHYRLAIDRKGIDLTLDEKVDNWVADEAKLRTTLDNLLSNAVNYTPDGGRISVVTATGDGNLVIDVANSGDPIPTQDIERVFEPFFQSAARRTGPIKGSGIGLSVARDCIQAQGGSLNLIPHNSLPICFRVICPEL
jgi:two-component system sensor histidine kinase GlrK